MIQHSEINGGSEPSGVIISFPSYRGRWVKGL